MKKDQMEHIDLSDSPLDSYFRRYYARRSSKY